jgi:alginate O-acetyltransferase complex protein AlgI
MPFNSLLFLIFLTVTAVLFYAVKNASWQKYVLITASFLFVFYFNYLSGVALGVICVTNYWLLKKMSLQQKKRKYLYPIGLAFNIAILLGYKILQDVLSDSRPGVLEGFDNSRWIVLGIGFYTLQIIGYYEEVYRRNTTFNVTMSDFTLGVTFFSKLPSGPILNLKDNRQLVIKEPVFFSEARFSYALQRILLGLFKKMALADRLMPIVNGIFDTHTYHNGLMIYLGPILFTIQVYLDFSAYIDIAIGSARLFGISLPENFRMPLRAASIVDFWRRWHISLVNWLTNYVFYPVSYRYRKMRKKGLAIAIFCTFIISALWHGIAVTFLIWAACHFIYIIVENLIFPKAGPGRKSRLAKIAGVFLVWHLVAFANLFFRSQSLEDASRLFHDIGHLPFLYGQDLDFRTWLANGGSDIEREFNFRLSFLLCLLFLAFEKKVNKYAQSEKYNIIYVSLMLILIAVFGMFNTGERFIYLQF